MYNIYPTLSTTDINTMLDPSKLPRLQPQQPHTQAQDDLPEETLWEQVIHVFSGKKGVLLACCISLLIYISVCFQGERILRGGVYSVFKELGEDGFGISYSAPSSYLAFKSGLNLDDVVITAPEKMGGWVLKTGRITVTSNPFTPRTIEIKANGTHSLTTKTIGDIRLVVGRGEITLHLPSKNDTLSLDAVFKNIQTAAPKSMEGFSVADFSLTLRRDPAAENTVPPVSFSVVSNNIRLPAYMAQHLPAQAEYIRLNGVISGLASGAEKSLLTNWTQSGGTAEITQGEIIWKPFMASFSGTFGFDNSFEMIGASVAKVYGFFDLLDMLEKGGYMRSSHVSVAKVVLGEKLKKEPGETQSSLTSPFSFQSGKVYAGPILLYDENGQ